MNTFGVQHSGNIQVLLSDVEGEVQVLEWVVLQQKIVLRAFVMYLYVCLYTFYLIYLYLIFTQGEGANI